MQPSTCWYNHRYENLVELSSSSFVVRNFPYVYSIMTFSRMFLNILYIDISSLPNVFAYVHEDSIDQQMLDNRFHIEMVFRPYAYEHGLVITMDEKMLCHKSYIYMATYAYECASSMRPTNCRFSRRIYIEIVF